MANRIPVPDTDTHITWRQGISNGEYVLYFTVANRNNEPIAKAKLTAEQLHKYICLHNTMK